MSKKVAKDTPTKCPLSNDCGVLTFTLIFYAFIVLASNYFSLIKNYFKLI